MLQFFGKICQLVSWTMLSRTLSVLVMNASMNFAGRSEEVLHVFSADFFDNALSRAWETLKPAVNLKLPWESGIWDNIFGPSNRSSSVTLGKISRPPVAPIPESVPVQCQPAKFRRVADGPQSWHQVVLASDLATWQEQHDAKMDTAMKRWFDVVIMFPTSFQLVAQLAELTTVGEQMKMMRDVLGAGSPLTLQERVDSVTRYMTFLRKGGLTAPGSESDLYSGGENIWDRNMAGSFLCCVYI